MSGFLDTNVIARYFTGDPPLLAARAKNIIDGGEDLTLTSVIIAETGYVLTKLYGASRASVVDALIELIDRDNVRLHDLDEELAVEALLLCRPSGRVSFADAMRWAIARAAGSRSRIYTLDNRFPSLGVEIRPELQ